mmetsp:Transcript_36656/g.86204  ORF Transcript_36656/g.86204 Transcript_36656/m.86204 type:complete len:201 (-) Transcript_36656:282-884(-)
MKRAIAIPAPPFGMGMSSGMDARSMTLPTGQLLRRLCGFALAIDDSSSSPSSFFATSVASCPQGATPRPWMRSLCAMIRCGVPWKRCPQSGQRYLFEPLVRSSTTMKYSALLIGLIASIGHPTPPHNWQGSSLLSRLGHAHTDLNTTFSSTFTRFGAGSRPSLCSVPVPYPPQAPPQDAVFVLSSLAMVLLVPSTVLKEF